MIKFYDKKDDACQESHGLKRKNTFPSPSKSGISHSESFIGARQSIVAMMYLWQWGK